MISFVICYKVKCNYYALTVFKLLFEFSEDVLELPFAAHRLNDYLQKQVVNLEHNAEVFTLDEVSIPYYDLYNGWKLLFKVVLNQSFHRFCFVFLFIFTWLTYLHL